MYCSIMTIHSTFISLNFGFWYGCDAALVYFFVVNYACYDLVCTPDIHFVPSAPIPNILYTFTWETDFPTQSPETLWGENLDSLIKILWVLFYF